MTRSLTGKLILAFLLVAITSVVILAVVVRRNTVNRLNTLVNDQQRTLLEDTLIDYYQTNGSLAGFRAYLFANTPIERGPQLGNPNRMGDDRRIHFGVVDASGQVVVPLQSEPRPGMRMRENAQAAGYPLMLDDEQIATILMPQAPLELTLQERAFLSGTNQALLIAALSAVLLALLVGTLLARGLTQPLRALTRAAESVVDGATPAEVVVSSNDELGELARAFNQMSQRVTRANALRRQMTADIAHDLRTPLTVVAGYLESMQEGVLDADPARLAVMYAEIMQLERLVEDLMTLSRADAGELTLNLQPLVLNALLEQTAASFAEQARKQDVELIAMPQRDPLTVMVDESRMLQVLGNLIANALRYTPAGGRISLETSQHGQEVLVAVRDTGRGIAPQDLPRVFDRLYRADASRSQEHGESGLGLAISRAIVQAHGGRIWAESELGEGASFNIVLPVQ